jgi:hypothetical protein
MEYAPPPRDSGSPAILKECNGRFRQLRCAALLGFAYPTDRGYTTGFMDQTTRNEVAEGLERLADQTEWNPNLHKRCYDLVGANWDNELLKYVHDDLIHHDGLFHSRSIFGFRRKPAHHQLEHYRYEFRGIGAVLRAGLSLVEAKKQFGL